MENKQSLENNRLISIKEKLIRKVDYDTITGVSSRLPQNKLLLDLEIYPKARPGRPCLTQRVLVSIKPRVPSIKTLYIAEKSRFHSSQCSKSASCSRLGIGDHQFLNSTHVTDFTEENSKKSNKQVVDRKSTENQVSSTAKLIDSKCSNERKSHSEKHAVNSHTDKRRPTETCYIYTQPQFTLNRPKQETQPNESLLKEPKKLDIATTPISKTSSEDHFLTNYKDLKTLYKRILRIERRLQRQEMVIQSLDPNKQLSSSDEECNDTRAEMRSARPCCSYIQQYSTVPETSAFHRYGKGSQQHSSSLDKEHNSEQYGRDFTTYDGITARNRRQASSVPSKRDEGSKVAAERIHKMRHKLNPVRDYRLMDTVHYLAQGEFAPRDDGIKLTPSREAVLSDIIWEDVCRTHWPNARLGRRTTGNDRYGTRFELQRLIDSLLRERVQHVERRRRRHYRIVKLNHRHESCRPLGKTGDIIVASHKKKDVNEEHEMPVGHSAMSAMMAERRWEPKTSKKGHRSHDRLMYPESRHRRRFREEECVAGPSSVQPRAPGSSREPTICYHTSPQRDKDRRTMNALRPPTPRLVVKKETSRHYRHKEETNLEQYILLPTLVIRTPSNVKRQKKFSELYHRILKQQIENKDDSVATEAVPRQQSPTGKPDMKDIGFNINIMPSSSDEDDKS